MEVRRRKEGKTEIQKEASALATSIAEASEINISAMLIECTSRLGQ